MRTWTLDQWEFDDPWGEESLEVTIAAKNNYEFPDVRDFIASAVGETALVDLVEPIAFDSYAGAGHARDYLAKYCSIDVPMRCDWPTYRVLDDGNYEWHVVICTPTGFIRFFWMTAA